ncbi:hypothetical protein [Flavobacterium aestuarii]|uniref:hypothetical protein n=1 Tax=Flavobacterium aestuarii TaxID=3149227 RepID=UPI0032B3869C
MYNKDFIDFVEKGVNEFYIGTGNPNSKILIIGKESAIETNNLHSFEWYRNNAQDWKKHIENKTCEVLEYKIDVKHPLRKSWGKNTWSKYQKLSDYILEKETENFKVDFLNHIFTSEINDSPSKTTSKADKTNISSRKEILKVSEFIQNFPVIVLACSDYITNSENNREINNIFDVEYIGSEMGTKYYSTGNWYFLHYNKNKTKLVIHTRQLSTNVNNELLKDLAKIIRKHLNQ